MIISYLPKPDPNRASSRYRIIIPSHELQKLGHEVNLTGNRLHSDWVVVNKAVGLDLRELQWRGWGKICLDMCDNHFITEHVDVHMKAACMADMITCSTQAMADVITHELGVIPKVIDDPLEVEIVPSKPFYDMKNPAIFWHGNNLSVPPLLETGRIIEDLHHKFWIDICNDTYEFKGIGADQYNWSEPYTQEGTLSGLSHSDVCIIPTRDDNWYRCKSPNRLINAVARGVFVIADHLPAYEPFKKWMWVGNIRDGLHWYKTQTSEEICQRITKCQEYIQRNHAPELIGRMWQNALSD